MSSKIHNYFSLEPDKNRVGDYEKKADSMSNAEARRFEMENLKPDKLGERRKAFKGKLGFHNLDEKRIVIYFNKKEDVELFGKYHVVNHYMGANTGQTGMIMSLLTAFEKGTIHYDEEKERLYRIRKKDKKRIYF